MISIAWCKHGRLPQARGPRCPLRFPHISSKSLLPHPARHMRTSRLLLALAAIQLLIMFTFMALPSIRSSFPKRASSFPSRPALSPPASPLPVVWHWHVDQATPAAHTSMQVTMKPYESWLMPPTPPLRQVQKQQLSLLRASGGGNGQTHSKASSSSFRKLNPKYAMKFNQEALNQQQLQQQQSGSDGISRPSSPSNQMFQACSTTCAGSVNFRYHVTPA